MLSLTMFEDLYTIASEQDLDLIKADYYRFTTSEEEETRTLRYTHLSQRKADYRRVFRPTEETESFFYVMNTWAGIYRLSFLTEHGIRHQETPGASYQDNGFWFQTFLYAERAKVYAMNREFDYIRGILEREPADWEALKVVYWRLRIRNYGATLNRIAPELREGFLETVSSEMKAGIETGEFRMKDLPPEERGPAEEMIQKEFTPAPPDMTEAEKLRASTSYRIGRAITRVPKKVIDTIHSKGAITK